MPAQEQVHRAADVALVVVVRQARTQQAVQREQYSVYCSS
jgi:hypothetical protein